jgi:ADP-heptose:LPS heptosyltransferase
VVTNQSGLARGAFGPDDLARVHLRLAELLGPFDVVLHCPHGEADGCACRKPRPGMVLAAATRFGVAPGRCLVVGDTAADVGAAAAAGATGVLVPNDVTRRSEVAAALHVARDLAEVVSRWCLPHAPGARSWYRTRAPASERDRSRQGLPPVIASHRPTGTSHVPTTVPHRSGPGRDRGPVLVARLDNAGDVLLAGPAVRAVARDAPVLLAVGPHGRAAADLLPGVDAVVDLAAPWILADPPSVAWPDLERFTALVASARPRAAAILTSSHQSALPLALLLRLAGVSEIAAVSLDHAGSLLDHRIPGDPEVHEVERALAVVAALGHTPAPGDDRLAVTLPGPPGTGVADALAAGAGVGTQPGAGARDTATPGAGRYVVVHPGASVPARTLPPPRWRDVVMALGTDGRRVVVTGGHGERALTAAVAAGWPGAIDLGGRSSLGDLARVLAGADALVCGNTGPMHLAAAVGTPVVAVFAPTVPLARWRPWKVRHLVLGDQRVPCRLCRSRSCPVPGQPCLAPATPAAVADAVDALAPAGGHATRSRPTPVPDPRTPEEVR